MFEEVRNGQRTLDSLTGWLASNTQISGVYRDQLVKIGAEYSASSQKADDYARLLDRSKTAMDGATSSAKSLASAQQASAAAVGGGAQAWDKYIAQLTQTRDLVGANAAQEAVYTATKAGFNKEQIEYARLVGEQTELLKKYEEAVKSGKKADQERLSSQLLVSIKSSEALRIQMEAQGKAMNKMAENAEESSKRQITAMQQAANFAVASAARMVSPLSAPQQNLQGASLLTFGQPQTYAKSGSASIKTPEQQLREMLDRLDGNTETKPTKTKDGLSSKLNEAQTAFDNLYKAAQPAKFALQEYVERQSQLELLLSKGKITQEEYSKALAQASINYAAAIKGAQGLTQAEQYRAQMERQLSIQRQQYAAQAAAVGMGGKEAERYQQRLQLEQQTNDRVLQLRTELAQATTEKQRQELQAQIDLTNEYLPQQVAAMEAGWAQMDAAMANPINGWTAAVQNFGAQATNVAGQTQSIWTNAFDTMTNGVTDQFMSLDLSLRSIGDLSKEVLRNVLAGFVKMGVQMAANAVLSSTIQAAQTTQAAASGAAIASAYAPAAATASIASFGGAAVAGLAAMTAAIPQMLSLVGFANGGYVTGPGTGRSDSIPAMLSNGEFVVNAEATRRNRSLLEAINSNDRIPSGSAASSSSSGATASAGLAPEVNIFNAPPGTQANVRMENAQWVLDVVCGSMEGDGQVHQVMAGKYGVTTVGR